jgi:uncharacterized protein (TIGR03435 family)
MNRCVQSRWEFCRKILLVIAVCMIPVLRGPGQNAAPVSQNMSAKAPAFTVAAIRPDKSGYGSWQGGPTPYGYSAKNVPVSELISFAYNLRCDGQLLGLSGWADSDRFDVEARMDEDDAAAFQKLRGQQQREQAALMLRPLLADRFKLKVHHETRVLPVYALVIAKGGFKLKESHEPGNLDGMGMNRGFIGVHASRIGGRVLEGLSDAAGRIVIDKTGLTGYYDITLRWTPDGSQTSDPNAPPDLFTALEEQLGLKLVSTKAPVDVLVVDHIERPTEN